MANIERVNAQFFANHQVIPLNTASQCIIFAAVLQKKIDCFCKVNYYINVLKCRTKFSHLHPSFVEIPYIYLMLTICLTPSESVELLKMMLY